MNSPSAVSGKPPYEQGGPPDPTRVVGILAKSTSPLSFTKITISQLAQAIDLTAAWLDSYLGPTNPNAFEPVAYIGLQDFRYWVMEAAGMKTGHSILHFSPRNALVNNVALFASCGCRALIYTEGFETLAAKHHTAIPHLAILKLATFDELFDVHDGRKVELYSYTKTWEQARHDPAIILHTSGSTGPPQPITYNHTAVGVLDSMRLIPAVSGRKAVGPQLLTRKVMFVGAPMFHLGGFAFCIQSLFSDSTTLLGPVDRPASAEVLSDLMRATKVQALLGTPALLENLVKNHGHELQDLCADLEPVQYVGGALSQSAGDAIARSSKAELSQNYGSTEMGNCHILMRERESWADFNWYPECGPDLDLVDEEQGLYEVVVRRGEDQLWSQGGFHTFPDLKKWRTKDLFQKREDGTWISQGRVDDVVVLKSGGKVSPAQLEGKLQSFPGVVGAVAFGDGRSKCGVIIEMKDKHVVVPQVVLDMIERENDAMPEHARIEHSMITLAKHDKPFIRAGKGTIVRKETLNEYAEDVEKLYRDD